MSIHGPIWTAGSKLIATISDVRRQGAFIMCLDLSIALPMHEQFKAVHSRAFTEAPQKVMAVHNMNASKFFHVERC